MPKITAEFKIPIDSPCLLAWPEGEHPNLSAVIGEFEINIELIPDEYWKSKQDRDEHWTTGISHLLVLVSRLEADPIPDTEKLDDGSNSSILRSQYFSARRKTYGEAARLAANRLISFFKYRLLTPLTREIPSWDNNIQNPIWRNESGEEVRSGSYTHAVEPIPGLRGELGSQRLLPKDMNSLIDHISNPPEPSLSISLLSDAQTAWHEGNLRRTILELAICAEVMVKRCYFAQATPAGSAFDYLEDKAKISVKVLDLLGPVAAEAFGVNYKDAFPEHYREIDHLFRCRNKIAHRGQLNFRDDGGALITVDSSRVANWWNVALHLKNWLDELQSNQPPSGA